MAHTNAPIAALGSHQQSAALIDWRAIAVGTVGASAVFAVLFTFGSALGLTMTSARSYGGLPATMIGIVLALWLAGIHVASFAVGGYLCGRLRRCNDGAVAEEEFRSGAHGFMVWALGTLLSVYLLAVGAGTAARSAADAATAAIGGATSVAATVGSPAPENASDQVLGYIADLMLRPPSTSTTDAGVTAQPTSGESTERPDTGSAVAGEIGRILATGAAAGELTDADRLHLTSLVATRTRLSRADAARRVDDVWSRFQSLRSSAQVKARDVAEAARVTGVLAAFMAAAVSLAGLIAAVWASSLGTLHRDENTALAIFGRSRFW